MWAGSGPESGAQHGFLSFNLADLRLFGEMAHLRMFGEAARFGADERQCRPRPFHHPVGAAPVACQGFEQRFSS